MKLGLANFTTLAWSIWQTFQLTLVQFFAFRQTFQLTLVQFLAFRQTFQLTLVQFFAFRQIFICANCQRLNKPSGHLVTPTTNIPSHPTLNLFDLTIPVYISRKQWLVSNCRPLILNATALPCTALPFTNTILLFLTHTHPPTHTHTHTHTQLPTFSLSHTLKRTHTYYISNSESIFLVTPETKPRGTARKAGIRFKSKLKFAAKANISI